ATFENGKIVGAANEPPLRCRIPKNALRAVSHRTRGSCWENSAPLLSFRFPVLDRATGPDDPTERRAVWLIPSTVPDICCIPEQRPPRRSRRPQPAPGWIGLPTCHAPHDCRRERDRSLCHRRLYCIVHVLWPMMA